MPDTSLRRVLSLTPHDQPMTLHLASLVGGDVPEYQRVQMTDAVTVEFGHVVFTVLSRLDAMAAANDLDLLAYEGGTKPDAHQVEWIHLPNYPHVQRQLTSLTDPAGELPVFQAASEFVEGLRFYVIGIHPEEAQPAFFFRWYSKKKELTRSRSFGALFRDGQFDQVAEPLFLFDQFIDCIVSGPHLFVINKAKFHQIFRFMEAVEEAGHRNVDAVAAAIPITNIDAFRESCVGHTQKLYKLNAIASKPYLNHITMDVLEETIQHHGLDIDVEGEGDDRRIVYDNRNRWGILKLLDDDYLESRMTRNLYEANSKRTRGQMNP